MWLRALALFPKSESCCSRFQRIWHQDCKVGLIERTFCCQCEWRYSRRFSSMSRLVVIYRFVALEQRRTRLTKLRRICISTKCCSKSQLLRANKETFEAKGRPRFRNRVASQWLTNHCLKLAKKSLSRPKSVCERRRWHVLGQNDLRKMTFCASL